MGRSVPISALVSKRRLVLLPAAVVFAAATILYSGLWIYSQRRQLPVQLGFASDFAEAEHGLLIRSINKGSAAEEAGLRAGDKIIRIDGEALESAYSMYRIWSQHKPGDTVELTVLRPDSPDPLRMTAVFRARPAQTTRLSEQLGQHIINTFPVAFVVVGLAVLFLRLDDPRAWLLALMFAGAVAIPDFSNWQALPPSLRKFAMADRAIFNAFNPALFYLFFAVFPDRSPLERRVPWLKWVGLALGLSMALPGLSVGAYQAPQVVGRLFGEQTAVSVRLSYGYGFISLGLVSLVGNALGASTADAKRKIRVILWGTLVGVVPIMVGLAAQDFFGSHMPNWLAAILVTLLYLFPLSFAYAVVKHRVLEIPVLLRRSARYLLVQRGFVLLMVLAGTAAALLFVLAGLRLARLFETEAPLSVPAVVLAAVGFGSLLALSGTHLHQRVSQRIDRAFFRSAYDARQILQGLAEATRTVASRRELAALLESQIEEALHPAPPCGVVAYVQTPDGNLAAVSGRAEVEPRTIPSGWPLLAELAAKAQPFDVLPSRASALSWLAALRPECLVPLAGREGNLEGLLVLGPRLSEEPYSREDKRLLASVASQAAVALESLRLAEQMAERLEAERRTAYEMGIAQQVQAKLFPQRRPPLATLDYVGGCVQARDIGGDYYDFLDMGPGRLGLVLADISGKGISAALLMANLQANLRSQYALALSDLPHFLASVNRVFHESTSPQHYATMFFGDYDDATRRLRYANCGHNPPLLLRANGELEQLGATATVLGLFDQWQTSVCETVIMPGDTLLIFSDGAPDARSDDDEMFGDERVLETLRKYAPLSAEEVLAAFTREIQLFSGREREDDLTLVVARGR